MATRSSKGSIHSEDASADAQSPVLSAKLRLVRRIHGNFGPFLRPYYPRLILAYSSLFGSVLLGLLKPWPLKLIIDRVLLDQPVHGKAAYASQFLSQDKSTLLVLMCLGIVVLAVFDSLFSYFKKYLLRVVGQGVTSDIREHIFAHFQTLPFSTRRLTRTGDVVLRLTSDIRALGDLVVVYAQRLTDYGFGFVSTLVVMALMDWKMTFLALAIVPPLYFISYRFSVNLRALAKKRRAKESEVASLVHEAVGSMAVVQAFAQEDREKRRFASESQQSLRAALESARVGGAFSRVVKILEAMGVAAVVWIGAWRVIAGELTPGDLIVFIAYVKNLYDPIDNLSELFVGFQESLVSGERIVELVETDSQIKDAPDAVEAPAFRGEVRFEAVTFGYGKGRPLFDRLSFVARPGQRVALVGSSGAGKTTVLNLLLRFLDPCQGRILLDGEDIRRFTLRSLRSRISVVFQEAVLFRRSVRENIAYGKPEAAFEAIVAAAKAAQAHDFILGLPDAYETVLDERGENLSGGQRQRIVIARAMLRNTPVLVLDEPATGLDAVTESQVDAAWGSLMEGRTTFIVAHRLSTIRKADWILVIEDGSVVEQGTHEQLLARSGRYRELHQAQHGQDLPLVAGAHREATA